MGLFGSDDEDKTGHSEEKTDLFGNSYIQEYDKDGKETGYSKTETGFFGEKYVQHYTQDDQKTGYSTEEKDITGEGYQQHHSQDGKETGFTKQEKGLFGNPYREHNTQDGETTGYSERETGLFGNRYTQHHGKVPSRPESATASSGESRSSDGGSVSGGFEPDAPPQQSVPTPSISHGLTAPRLEFYFALLAACLGSLLSGLAGFWFGWILLVVFALVALIGGALLSTLLTGPFWGGYGALIGLVGGGVLIWSSGAALVLFIENHVPGWLTGFAGWFLVFFVFAKRFSERCISEIRSGGRLTPMGVSLGAICIGAVLLVLSPRSRSTRAAREAPVCSGTQEVSLKVGHAIQLPLASDCWSGIIAFPPSRGVEFSWEGPTGYALVREAAASAGDAPFSLDVPRKAKTQKGGERYRFFGNGTLVVGVPNRAGKVVRVTKITHSETAGPQRSSLAATTTPPRPIKPVVRTSAERLAILLRATPTWRSSSEEVRQIEMAPGPLFSEIETELKENWGATAFSSYSPEKGLLITEPIVSKKAFAKDWRRQFVIAGVSNRSGTMAVIRVRCERGSGNDWVEVDEPAKCIKAFTKKLMSRLNSVSRSD